MKTYKKLFAQTFLVGVALLCAAGVSLAYSTWSAPTAAPPGNNTDTPLNTGTSKQIKSGTITAGAIGAPSICIGTDCRSAWPTGSAAGYSGTLYSASTRYINQSGLSGTFSTTQSFTVQNGLVIAAGSSGTAVMTNPQCNGVLCDMSGQHSSDSAGLCRIAGYNYVGETDVGQGGSYAGYLDSSGTIQSNDSSCTHCTKISTLTCSF